MKRQSLVLLAVAFVAAGAAGCFKDPVSSLRGGPAVITTNAQAVFLKTGDSATVIAYLKDNAGNELAVTGATWVTQNAAIAAVDVPADSLQPIPGNAYTRAFIRGVDSISGGWTNVIVTSRGIADTIRVVVLPAKLTSGLVATSGASLTDTVIVPASILPPLPPDTLSYAAKDTLVISGTSLITFDTSKVAVSVSTLAGNSPGFVVSKTPSQIKVVFEVGTAGKVMVNHLLETPGNAKVGTVTLDTLIGDSVAVAPVRIGQAAFGITAGVASNVLTVTLPAGMSFLPAPVVVSPTDTIPASYATFNGAPVAVIALSATTLSFFSTVPTSTASVTVYHVAASGPGVSAVYLDSLSSNVGGFTLSPANLPNANVAMSPNNGKLGDTIIVTAPAGMTFSTSGAVSQVVVGNTAIATSDTAWNLSLTPTTLKVFPKRGGSSNLTVTNMVLPVAGAVPFALTTPGTTTIDSLASDFGFATTKATAHVATIPASGVDTVYGTVNCTLTGCQQPPFGVTTNDYWTFTTAATQTITGFIYWYGSGSPYGTGSNTPANTADLDMVLCNTAQACPFTEANDLWGGGAATSSMPEHSSVAAMPAGQYWVNVIPFTGPQTVVYRLIITLQ